MKVFLSLLLTAAVVLLSGGVAQAQDVPAVSNDVPAAVAAPAAVTEQPSETMPVADAPVTMGEPSVEPVLKTETVNADDALASASETMKETATGDVGEEDTAAVSAIESDINGQLEFLQPPIDVNLMPSLFFSKWEHDLIVSFRRGVKARPADAPDDGTGISTAPNTNNNTPSGPREVYLSGIVYRSAKDWTVWLNGLRVTPTAIPNMVMDIKVFKDYIEMDWLDASTNRIYPIRLRTQQKFNLDTRMFLQGQG